MMDLSDGLASDLRHIMERSHVGASIDIERIPVADGSDVVTAVTGGEDYKLLFTAASEAGYPLYPIGAVTSPEADEIVWLNHGERIRTDWHGYEHNA